MKKNLLSIMVVAITAMLMPGNAGAQVAMINSSNAGSGFSTSNNASIKGSISAANVNFRTLKDFKKRFATTTDVIWQETDNGYLAKFSAGLIETMIAYGQHGTWFYTIQRYYERNLPADVRALVKSTYYDYTIVQIEEVNVPQQENTIYILHLRDNKNFKIVRVCGDEMEVIEDYHE